MAVSTARRERASTVPALIMRKVRDKVDKLGDSLFDKTPRQVQRALLAIEDDIKELHGKYLDESVVLDPALRNALLVILLSETTSKFLLANDPKAVLQALSALNVQDIELNSNINGMTDVDAVYPRLREVLA